MSLCLKDFQLTKHPQGGVYSDYRNTESLLPQQRFLFYTCVCAHWSRWAAFCLLDSPGTQFLNIMYEMCILLYNGVYFFDQTCNVWSSMCVLAMVGSTVKLHRGASTIILYWWLLAQFKPCCPGCFPCLLFSASWVWFQSALWSWAEIKG